MTQVPALVFPSPDIEERRGLPPDTLDQQARIVELDDEQICFDIALRGLDRSYVDLRSWTVYLRTSEGIRVRKYENVRKPQFREVETENHQGRIPHQIHMGNETYCSQKDQYEQCVRWSERPIMKTEWTPGEVEVAQGGGTVCFHVVDFDPTAIDKLALRLNVTDRSLVVSPDASMDQAVAELPGPGRITFQWNYEP